ncbi:MAG: citrate synthase, partial [bacterium]
IQDLARDCKYIEVAHLLIWGKLPNKKELGDLRAKIADHSFLHEDLKKFFDGFPPKVHPMVILSSMLASLSAYYPDTGGEEATNQQIIHLLAKAKTIAAYSYKKSIGEPYIYPRPDLSYPSDFFHMMFAKPNEDYKVPEVVEKALDLLLVLHADHEQNCSTSTVRMVGSSHANLFASIAAGNFALWGPLHGGANAACIEMLEMIHADGGNYKKYVDMAKDKASGFKLMGFGHRVYKNFDPRSRILKEVADDVLNLLGVKDPLLDIAKKLEDVALKDEFFVERKLYPNVDFYSGILYRALGIPKDMFTVMFALGRMAGWIAQWKELRDDPTARIYRPRQIYTGGVNQTIVPLEKR